MLKPITREIIADLETPVSTYLKLSGNGPAFLLESVTGGENVARYSFIGLQPSTAFVIRGQTTTIHSGPNLELTEKRGITRLEEQMVKRFLFDYEICDFDLLNELPKETHCILYNHFCLSLCLFYLEL